MLPSKVTTSTSLRFPRVTSPKCPSRTRYASTPRQRLFVGGCPNMQGQAISRLQTSNQSPATCHCGISAISTSYHARALAAYELPIALASITAPQAARADAGDPGKPVAHRDRFCQQNEAGKAGNPEQIHDATEEQQAHQEPAAPQAIGAVLEPHAEGAEPAMAPTLDKKAQWRAAMPQAHPFDRGELPYAGGDKDGTAKPIARCHHHR